MPLLADNNAFQDQTTHWMTPLDHTVLVEASEPVDNNLAFAADPSDCISHNFSPMMTRKMTTLPSGIVLYSASVDKLELAERTVRAENTEAVGIADLFGMSELADMD